MYYKECGSKDGQLVVFIHGLNGFSFENAAFEVIKLIEELSPDRKVILIAHSYGGLVVKEILLRIPHRIDKMVVGSTNIQKSLLFWLYTGKIGCHILWKQNEERYAREGITWKRVCDMQKDAWHKFDISGLKGNHQIACLFLYAEHDIKEIQEQHLLHITPQGNPYFQ